MVELKTQSIVKISAGILQTDTLPVAPLAFDHGDLRLREANRLAGGKAVIRHEYPRHAGWGFSEDEAFDCYCSCITLMVAFHGRLPVVSTAYPASSMATALRLQSQGQAPHPQPQTGQVAFCPHAQQFISAGAGRGWSHEVGINWG